MNLAGIEAHPKIRILRELEREAARLSDRIFNYLGSEDDLRQHSEHVRELLTKRLFLDRVKLQHDTPLSGDMGTVIGTDGGLVATHTQREIP